MPMGLLLLTLFHTAVSVIALLAGMAVVSDLMHGTLTPRWTRPFLITAIITSVTGYFFPISQVLPSHVVGAVALLVLAATLVAQYSFHLRGVFRAVFVGGLVASEFFLAFVLVAQLFNRVPGLKELAPDGGGPAFGLTQLAVLGFFLYAGLVSVRRTRDATSVMITA